MGSSLLSSDPSSSTSFPSEPYPTSEPEPYQTTDSAPYQARDPELNQLRDSEAMAATTTIPSEGLTDLMAIARLAGHWPERRALVAIQPDLVGWGELPTEQVAAAVPGACAQIQSLIGTWRHAAA